MAGLRHRRAEIWLAGVRTAGRTARGIVSPRVSIPRVVSASPSGASRSRPKLSHPRVPHPRVPCVPRVADGYSPSTDRRPRRRQRHPDRRGMSDPQRASGPSGPAAPSGQSNGLVRHLRRRLASCASNADHGGGARSRGRIPAIPGTIERPSRRRRPASDRRHGRGVRPGWVPPSGSLLRGGIRSAAAARTRVVRRGRRPFPDQGAFRSDRSIGSAGNRAVFKGLSMFLSVRSRRPERDLLESAFRLDGITRSTRHRSRFKG